MYLGAIILFVAAGVFFSPFIMQASPRSEVSLAIEEITGLVIAIGGIVAFVLEYTGRKKEAAETKRFVDLFGQKAIENLPRIEMLYDIARKSEQIPVEYQGIIEQRAKEVKEAAQIGRKQLEIVHEALKPQEKAASLIIPRESTDTSPVPDPSAPQPTIAPKKVQ